MYENDGCGGCCEAEDSLIRERKWSEEDERIRGSAETGSCPSSKTSPLKWRLVRAGSETDRQASRRTFGQTKRLTNRQIDKRFRRGKG